MEEMTGESAYIFFNILFIADDSKDVLEDTHLASLCHRDGKTRLNHQGEKPQCLQSNCLPTCIRSAYDENPDPVSHSEMDGNTRIFTLNSEGGIRAPPHSHLPLVLH